MLCSYKGNSIDKVEGRAVGGSRLGLVVVLSIA